MQKNLDTHLKDAPQARSALAGPWYAKREIVCDYVPALRFASLSLTLTLSHTHSLCLPVSLLLALTMVRRLRCELLEAVNH